MPENLIAAEIEPVSNQARQAALALQRLGFRILHLGQTISVQGPQSLWESTFNVSFEPREKTLVAGVEGSRVTYQKALIENVRIPSELRHLVVGVMFVEPPEFYSTRS